MRRFHPPLACLFLLALVFSGCGGPGSAEDGREESSAEADSLAIEEEEAEAAAPVEVIVVRRGPIESVLSSSATLEAESEVIVVAEAARRVQSRLVEEGDRVEEGDLLMRLQDAEQRSALAKAETLLDQARREFERQQRLHERELTTEKALNDARAVFEQRKLELQDAQRELSYTEVRAPIDGTITQRFVSLGDQVNPGTQLFEIIDFESMIAHVYAPEKDLTRLEVGQDARIRAPALGERVYPAKVERISPIVDARTGTVKVTVAVGAQPGLRPGLYVDVDIVTDIRTDAVRVPKRALVYGEDQLFVFRIGEGRRARRTLIEPELEDRQYVVPSFGVSAGDSLITAGQAGLKDGTRVRIVDRDEESEEQEPGGAVEGTETAEASQP